MDEVSDDGSPAGDEGFDRDAAVTRSLLGYGVIAGPFYLVVGVAQVVGREGFDATRHSLSLLANGSWGWIQIANLIVAGLMAIAAGLGFARAMKPAWSVGALVAAYGVSLVLAGTFTADPMEGFPPGTPDGSAQSTSLSGVIHLAAGAIGFLALIAAFVLLGAWFARRDDARLALGSRLGAIVVMAAFTVGAATATTSVGVVALWIAVVVGWAWLAVASVAVYRTVRHPDANRRDQALAHATKLA